MTEKFDFKKELPEHYEVNEGEVVSIKMPATVYLGVTGKGVEAESETDLSLTETLQLVAGIAFSMKFRCKQRNVEGFFDYIMPPNEALRWVKSGKLETTKPEKRHWQALLPQPSYITATLVKTVLSIAQQKEPNKHLPKIELVKHPKMTVIQTLHVGPYEDIAKPIKLLKDYAKKNKLKMEGKHHEVYLNDPRRTKPQDLKTIIRYQVK